MWWVVWLRLGLGSSVRWLRGRCLVGRLLLRSIVRWLRCRSLVLWLLGLRGSIAWLWGSIVVLGCLGCWGSVLWLGLGGTITSRLRLRGRVAGPLGRGTVGLLGGSSV